MVTLARTSSGLLYRSDGSLTGWTGAPQWASVSAIRLIASPSVPMSPGANSSQTKGEPKWNAVGNIWYMSYDDLQLGGQSVPAIQRSSDRGITWTDLGPIKFAAAIPDAGVAITSHYLDPVSGAWYVHLLSGGSITPGGGLNSPYQYYIYKSTGDITGPYVLANAINPTVGTWCDQGSQSGSCYYDGTQYILFGAGYQPAAWAVAPFTGNPVNVLGQWQCTTLAGAVTQTTPGTPLLDVTKDGPVQPGVFAVENVAYGYNSVLNLFIIAANTDVNDGTNAYSYATLYQTSATPTGFAKSGWKMMQWPCPADATTILDVTQFLHNGPNSQLAVGPNGEMAGICSNQKPGGPYTPYYSNLRPIMSVIEPATALIRYAGAGDAIYRQLVRSLAHTDITIELACEVTGIKTDNNVGEFHVCFRSDGTGNNEYRVVWTTGSQVRLDKMIAGVPTYGIAAGAGTQTFDNKGAPLGFQHRLKAQVVGNVHKAWLDGELQYTFTDSSSPFTSGASVSLGSVGLNCDVINLSCRTSDTITVTGMQPRTSCWLRAACGIPIAPIVADSSGVGAETYQHYPLYALDLGGTDYTVGTDSRIWGGDTLQFSGLPSSPPVPPDIHYYT